MSWFKLYKEPSSLCKQLDTELGELRDAFLKQLDKKDDSSELVSVLIDRMNSQGIRIDVLSTKLEESQQVIKTLTNSFLTKK